MIINYGTFDLSKNLDDVYLYKYQFNQIYVSKIVEKCFLEVFKNSNYAYELYVLKPQLVSVVSNYLNILCKINEIKIHQEIKINKNQWMIAGSILENSIIKQDNLINIQKKIYKKYKLIHKIKNTINIKLFSQFFNNYVFSSNELSLSFFKNKKNISVDVNNLFPINLETNHKSKLLAKDFIENLAMNLIANNFFRLSENQKKSIENLCNIHFNRLFNNIDKNFIKNNFKNIYISNSQNYVNRLASFMLKGRAKSIHGFDHGGEKIFYKENHYYKNELDYVNNYNVYSNYYNNYLKNINTRNVKINKVVSIYNNHIYKKYFNNKNKNKNNILLLGGSIDGETSGNLYLQNNDDINKIKFIYKIKSFLSEKYKYKIKLHPKSRLDNINHLFKQNELINLHITELFDDFNIFILDYLGTTLKECLCAGKEVIFFDHGIYSFNDIFKNELSKIIHVIPLKYQNNTSFYFDKKYLLYALNNKKSTNEDKLNFINKFYL